MHTSKLKKIVSIFIFSKNQLLLQLRDKKEEIVYPGCWGLISGSLNCNENPFTGIRREVQEEISITNLKNLNFVDTFLSCGNENIIYYVFKININNPSKIILKEGVEYSFFSKSEFLKGYKFSRKLKKTCYVVNNTIMKKFYFRTLNY